MTNLPSITQKIDRIESAMAKLPRLECPLTHTFTPGLYSRQITMPKNALIVSLTHKTEHPFLISKGDVSVWSAEGGVTRLRAPYIGVTKAGTRRILFIHDECVWTTFHVTNMTDPDAIVADVTEPHNIGAIGDSDGEDLLAVINQLCGERGLCQSN